MAGLRLRGLYARVDGLTQVLAREAATQIGQTLAKISPQYSGEFADHWEIKVGNVPIYAETPAIKPRPTARQPRRSPILPVAPSLKGISFSGTPLSGKNVEYSIGNTMEYRDIAMDLVPGRVERAKELSAPQDWYVLYLNSPRGLRRDIEFTTGLPVVQSAWANAKGRPFIGPAGRFIR